MSRVKKSAKSIKLNARERPDKIQAMNIAQGQYLAGMEDNFITFGLGNAGTGKSYCSVILACEHLYEGKVDRVILTRPAVESGRGLGFLKGDLEEKFAPYINPVKQAIISVFGKGWFESQLKNENIVAQPLEYIQGLSFDNSFIIADEAENMTAKEIYILLTRIGVNSKMVLNGDCNQAFIRDSGLAGAISRLQGLDGVFVHEFTSDDVVRSEICKAIIKRYEETPLV